MVELIDADEAAAALGVTRDTINKWCQIGKIEGATKGPNRRDRWVIPRSALRAILAPPEGLTLEEAGALLDLEPKYLSGQCRSGRMKGVRKNNRWYVQKEDALAFAKMRKDLHDIDYAILRDPVALWECYETHGFSLVNTAKACRCHKNTLRDYFVKHGLKTASKKRVRKAKIESLRGSGIPEACPRNCPSRIDCLEEGSVCYYDPDQEPLDTTPRLTEEQWRREKEWTSAESARNTSEETRSRSSSSLAAHIISTRASAPRS
jgi:hypothetical protein